MSIKNPFGNNPTNNNYSLGNNNDNISNYPTNNPSPNLPPTKNQVQSRINQNREKSFIPTASQSSPLSTKSRTILTPKFKSYPHPPKSGLFPSKSTKLFR